MVEFEELRLRLLDSEKPIENLKEALAIDSLKAEVEVLEKESAAPDFWDDMENSQKVMQKIGSLKAKVTGYESLRSDYEDALVMIELADEEGDLSLLDDCTASVKDIETRVEDMTLSTLLSGEFDGKNALLTFTPVPAVRRRRIGRKCSFVCTTAGASAMATRCLRWIIWTAMWRESRAPRF